jgi:hypothetical protein
VGLAGKIRPPKNVHSCPNPQTRVCSLDSLAPPSELLEMCVQSLDEMGTVFDDANVYMLHMMYQAMGVCLYLGDWDGAIHYGEKILKPYRSGRLGLDRLAAHRGGEGSISSLVFCPAQFINMEVIRLGLHLRCNSTASVIFATEEMYKYEEN